MKKITCLLLLIQSGFLIAQSKTVVTPFGEKVTISPFANNGLEANNGFIQLGGDLIKPSVLNTTKDFTLAIQGLQSGNDTDNVLVTDANGVIKYVARNTFGGGGDNLGNHTATENLMMSGHDVVFADRLISNKNTFSIYKDNEVFGIYNSKRGRNSLSVLENGNIGINTIYPDNSAILDINSTNQGVLLPRVTLSSVSDNTTILSPATSLLVYNTNPTMIEGNGTGLYINMGTPTSPNWLPFGVGIASSVAGQTMRYPCAPLTVAAGTQKTISYLTTYTQPNGANGAVNYITGGSLSGGNFSLPPGTYRVDLIFSGTWDGTGTPQINAGTVKMFVNNTLYSDHLYTTGTTLSDVITILGTANSIFRLDIQTYLRQFVLDTTTSGASSRSIILITRLK